ncbi:MAG: MBL fold metallo-hydrolase RNA specificity domain-containing protein, partial [Actinomycetota bacterium]
VENAMVAEFRSAPAMTLILYSAQNMDRLVTIYRAAKRAGKTLVVDLYTATVAAAAGRETIPQPGFPLIAVYVPIFQRIAVKKAMDFERVKAIKPHRLYVEDLVEQKENLVMTFSMGMVRELDKAGCLEGARAVWSMWPGYLGYPSSDKLREFLAAHDIPLSVHHASGHAYVKDLKRMAEAVTPKRLVPIHSFNTDRFADLFPNVEIQPDGAWWEV